MELSEFTEEKNDGACYAGQPVDNTKEELLQALKDAFNKVVDKRKEELLEEDLEFDNKGKYFQHWDIDSVDAGVGRLIVRKEAIQDEDQAFEDAKEEIIEEIVNEDLNTIEDLFEDNKFTIALGAFLKGC